MRLDPQWRCFFEDSTQLDLVENAQAMSDTVCRYTHDSTAGRRLHGASSRTPKRSTAISERYYFWKPIGGIRDMFECKRPLRR